MENMIAERKMVFIKAGQAESIITISIGIPYKVNEVQWSCPVALDGAYEHLSDISGGDSFQALMLAQRLLRTLLRGLVEDGGQILDLDERKDVDINALFDSGT
jgi:hypothetical protein